jgi:hypothetical protein
MVPVHERILIFAGFIGVGALVVGIVAYRGMDASTSRMPKIQLSLDDRASSTPKQATSAPIAFALAQAEPDTAASLPALIPLRVAPVSVTKSEAKSETLAMLPPTVSPREKRSSTQSGKKSVQLDICAKIGKRRVYYNKGKGQYWRCR